MSGLSCVGVFWSILSLLAAAAAAVGFYMPYWMQGAFPDGTPIYFGVFRRCNYPRYDSATSTLVVVQECGRYSTFLDIPSLFWQIATVSVGIGCGLALLVAMTAVMAICVRDVITPKVSRVAAALQVCAVILIGGGVAIYPMGWESQEVKQACDNSSKIYALGGCQLMWSLYLTAAGAGLTLIASFFSCRAPRHKATPAAYRV